MDSGLAILASRAACALPPAIMSHPDVAADVVRARHDDRERRHSLTYRALAVAVLRAAGAPLHWREIADRADALGRGTRASRGALCNALRSGRDTFVRVGPGLYGLTAWRIASVAPYPDLIARVLHEAGRPTVCELSAADAGPSGNTSCRLFMSPAGRPLTLGEIRRRVDRVRPITSGSLQLCLATHARFYRSLDKTYGLRAWLPPTPVQPAPRWQVEDETSALRVGRATARGIDVARMTARDRGRAERLSSDTPIHTR